MSEVDDCLIRNKQSTVKTVDEPGFSTRISILWPALMPLKSLPHSPALVPLDRICLLRGERCRLGFGRKRAFLMVLFGLFVDATRQGPQAEALNTGTAPKGPGRDGDSGMFTMASTLMVGFRIQEPPSRQVARQHLGRHRDVGRASLSRPPRNTGAAWVVCMATHSAVSP